ncbi:MAG: hypothetical protein Ct9H90mP27_5260 [Gammaproteobacteria bacterium]|nr:MAG: hypothetical protein Ct9H90mP27_5260 [Gammaproteobacteria bacterium]
MVRNRPAPVFNELEDVEGLNGMKIFRIWFKEFLRLSEQSEATPKR